MNGERRERWIRWVWSLSDPRINSRKSYNTNNFRTHLKRSSSFRAFLFFIIHHAKWNSNEFEIDSKTIRPLSIIIKIESFPSFELSGISGITEWIRETRKQRIGRIGLRERGERDGSDSGRAEGWKSFLPLTKISNNWPENERLWRIKRGHRRKTSL